MACFSARNLLRDRNPTGCILRNLLVWMGWTVLQEQREVREGGQKQLFCLSWEPVVWAHLCPKQASV